MALADVAMYAALLAQIGLVPLAVTTNLNINFLRKPPQKDVLAQVEIIKLGARLAVGEVRMSSEGESELIASASVTYSVPPKHV
jgi:acyl-coenzyme A thioesterase PaaI-like protein